MGFFLNEKFGLLLHGFNLLPGLNKSGLDGRIFLEWVSSHSSSYEGQSHALGVKAQSLLFEPLLLYQLFEFLRARCLGDVTPCSNFETVDKANPIFLARSSCVNPVQDGVEILFGPENVWRT